MLSSSALTITWLPPDIAAEAWEFTHHPAKQPFYLRHALRWDDLLSASVAGTLVPWPRSSDLAGIAVEGAYHRYEDYEKYLARAKRGYRLNYARLEATLQRAGALHLPAPIVLVCGGEALLFSGYRRLCLAWNYGMIPFVWQVRIPPRQGFTDM
ncbi:MAG: hypothetical protein A2091_07165 [Desulfuromonadales bacterium GWD2_61_12]|nr:MAG: hypothetical protein A2091_07165 [Desulfuromonadales bacterium GWD2_61_12]HAD04330.1 hypothetical protein [Desulfuromonas sp.]HBT83376.1 hypothetical protein [Desulfuromonas sp.]